MNKKKTTAASNKKASRRVLISKPPFIPESPPLSPMPPATWPAKWVWHPDEKSGNPEVLAFHLRFQAAKAMSFLIHVSADERYELFLDGERIGRGPERGDPRNWNFESYRINIGKGVHHLASKVWWLGPKAPAPSAQMTVRPAFLLASEGGPDKWLATGYAPWKVKRIEGIRFMRPDFALDIGARIRLEAACFPWGFEKGVGDGWEQAVPVSEAMPADLAEYSSRWLLSPAKLPPMLEERFHAGDVRHLESINDWDTQKIIIDPSNHIGYEAQQWDRLFSGKESLAIPAKTWRRVVVDIGEYVCAYPSTLVSGGRGAKIRIRWAESLYLPQYRQIKGAYKVPIKGNRDKIEGKFFRGIGDEFEPDGNDRRLFEPLWWGAGRFLEITVRTDDQPLVIEDFHFIKTGYPHSFTGSFRASDKRLGRVFEISERTLRMCSHETYMDCPYYEQLMYVGDTRLQALASYVLEGDDRLVRKAIGIFDSSRTPCGLTQSRYPCREPQIIPPFSLWWVAMLHDFSLWRGDISFIKEMLPGMRAALDHFASCIRPDGLIANPKGWNFLDWVEGWTWGVHPDGGHGVSGSLNWHAAMAFRMASELEKLCGEPELQKRFSRLAHHTACAADGAFWDEGRKLYADDIEHRYFSEHAQCLAVLSGLLPRKKARILSETLFTAEDISKASIYFSHYFFESCRLFGRIDRFFDRLGIWFEHESAGLTTLLESPEPSRSDCHAWSAHPIYHFAATIAGIRPSACGFAKVEIRPQLGPLKWIDAKVAHPKGIIRVKLRRENGNILGYITLPGGLEGTLVAGGKRKILGRKNTIEI